MMSPVVLKPRRCIAATLMLALALLGSASCTTAASEPSDASPKTAKVITVSAGEASKTLRFPGTAEAGSEVDLAFRVGGPVVAIPVKEGQRVAKNASLAVIDPRDYRVALRSSEARLQAAKAQLVQATRDFERAETLVEASAYPEARLDDARARLDVSSAEVLAAERGVEAARLALSDTSLRAPFAGRVAAIDIEDHQNVAAGQPIMRLQADSAIHLQIDVPETQLPALLSADPGALQVQFREHSTRDFPARVAKHRSRIDPITRTYRVEVQLDETPEVLTPGMSGEVLWTRTGGGATLTVPLAAIASTPDGASAVFVVEENVLRRQVVELGSLHRDCAVVVSGLSDGQRILAAGASRAQDGQSVQPFSFDIARGPRCVSP
ncbi:MAG: efflux RND transporter periplasmic adaptor subunit [Myxococcota bacterium]